MAILFTFGRIGTLERLISFSKMAADDKLIVMCAHACVTLSVIEKQTLIPFGMCSILVLTIFNEGAYLISKSIFHKPLNLFEFDCEITLESVPGTNQY